MNRKGGWLNVVIHTINKTPSNFKIQHFTYYNIFTRKYKISDIIIGLLIKFVFINLNVFKNFTNRWHFVTSICKKSTSSKDNNNKWCEFSRVLIFKSHCKIWVTSSSVLQVNLNLPTVSKRSALSIEIILNYFENESYFF